MTFPVSSPGQLDLTSAGQDPSLSLNFSPLTAIAAGSMSDRRSPAPPANPVPAPTTLAALSSCTCPICCGPSPNGDGQDQGETGAAIANSAIDATLTAANPGLPLAIAALLAPGTPRWNASAPVGTPVTITYSFMAAPPTYTPADWVNFQVFNALQQAAVRAALQRYADIANITFVEVPDTGEGGTMRFGYADREGFRGWAFYPTVTSPAGGDVWISNTRADLTPGGPGFTTLLHEIGHALGLKHPADHSPVLPVNQDNDQYTLMSYYLHPTMTGVEPSTPQLFDIAALQYLYGVNSQTRTDDTVYQWQPDASVIATLWDGGGVDTLDASNQPNAVVLNLGAGEFSSLGRSGGQAAINNLAIAQSVLIENAIGGAGADQITGNAAANRLEGGAGDDTIAGLAGNDRLFGDAGNDRLAGGAGDDVLDGGTGSDEMRGGSGNDTYVVDHPYDRVIEAAGSGLDQVYSDISYSLPAHVEDLFLLDAPTARNGLGNALDNQIQGNAYNNYLYGGAGNDLLIGLEGNDYLIGGAGNDTLAGGLGNDTLAGGTGADAFYFGSLEGGGDRLLDFNAAAGDWIAIKKSGFSPDLELGPLADSRFTLGAISSTLEQRFLYDPQSGFLAFDLDGGGEFGAIAVASLTPGTILNATDIVVIS